MTRALIDGDILLYRTGYASDKDEEWVAVARMKETFHNIMEETGCNDYVIYISDSANNFRKELFKDYKANRTAPKPVHLEGLTNVLLSQYNTEVAWEEEADDALGIAQGSDTVICSIDKDLFQIPGKHYNWVTGNKTEVSQLDGLRFFYTQLLCGDSTDNIRPSTGLSCPGVGEKKAFMLLDGLTTEEEMFNIVVQAYRESLKDKLSDEDILARILLTGRLIKIRKEVGEIWTFPFVPSQSLEPKQ